MENNAPLWIVYGQGIPLKSGTEKECSDWVWSKLARRGYASFWTTNSALRRIDVH